MKKISKVSILLFFLLTLFLIQSYVSSFSSEKDKSNETKPRIERHFVFDSIPLNLEEIEKSADRIFSGTCTKAEEIEKDSESGGLPVFKYTFKITDGVKGVENKETVTFKQWKPVSRGTGYEVGKKYVLFLYPNSKRNLTSTIGVDGQGYFEVEEKGIIRRKEYVVNKFKNYGLSRNLRTQRKIWAFPDKSAYDYIEYCSEHGIPIRYKEFIKAVRFLVEKNN